MNGEIEFLDPEPDPGAPADRPAPARRTATVVAALAWAAAAALAAVAPFQRLYGGPPRRYADYLPGGGVASGVDGWGNNGGGVRFGIVLEVCAAAFAVLSLAMLVRLSQPGFAGRRRRTLTPTAIGAPCLLAGLTAALGLYVAANPSLPAPADLGWTAYVPLHQSEAFTSTLMVVPSATAIAHSWCLWLAVAALACAVLAAVFQLLGERNRTNLAG